jgi:hypothetical protein
MICYSFIYSGCVSTLEIESGLMKTVTIFFSKMLFHSIRQPASFMMLTSRVEYGLTADEINTHASKSEGGGRLIAKETPSATIFHKSATCPRTKDKSRAMNDIEANPVNTLNPLLAVEEGHKLGQLFVVYTSK